MDATTTAIVEAKCSYTPNRKRRDLVELAVAYALILIVIWTPRPWQKIIYLVAAAFIVASTWISFPGWKAMGLRTANLARSSWLVGAALLAAALASIVARRMHTLHAPGGPVLFLTRFEGYIIFAFVQQALLQDFFLLRLLRLIRGPAFAALAAAAIFSLAHLPNPILTVATFVWGLASCLFFLRYRNLYPLAVAHAILGITLAISVPGPVIRNMRVGLGYLTYPSQHRLHRNH
jgi:membrane protease YdiL (CAAX protease family)